MRTMAEKNSNSWELRYRIWKEKQAGKTEKQALDGVLPTKDATGKRINKRRADKLKKWKAAGLWPIPPEELEAHGVIQVPTPSEQSDHSEQETQGLIQPEHSERSEHGLPENWEDRVRGIAIEVCHEMLQNIRNELKPAAPQIPSREDIPPAPKDITRRKQDRIYGKIGATVDGVLVRKLNQEAHDRKTSVGKLLDEILWNRYGRPLLSFQAPEEEQDGLRAEFQKPKEKDPEPDSKD
jgi:hypothetical protein